MRPANISGIDLFCGAGGLTSGLRKADINIIAGVDIDTNCKYSYEWNNGQAQFIGESVTNITGASLSKLLPRGSIRLLAGCAPCQPFSKLTNGSEGHKAWNMLDQFGRLIREMSPELVTMENVPELAERGKDVLDSFLSILSALKYEIDYAIVKCEDYGVPQQRRRFVLLASKLGPIKLPKGKIQGKSPRTVRDAIGELPMIESGETHWDDPLHCAAKLSPLNLRRMQSTPKNGGTWKSWPEELRLECHKRDSGKTYGSVYGRMWWDQPAPTMTTLCTGLGNGRFGHPEQDRPISLREAALIQSFPKGYRFTRPGEKINRSAVSRMIGNAVPPKLATALGRALLEHVKSIKG